MNHSNHNHKNYKNKKNTHYQHSPVSNPCTDRLTELEYLEHMIPHHQVAIDMSKLLIPHTKSHNITFM